MIFPNPVQSQLHIVSESEMIQKVVLMDLYGRRLEAYVGEETMVLDVSHLRPGVYLLGLTLERGLVNRIFLKR